MNNIIKEKLIDKSPYSLVHISKKANIENIIKTKKFIPSKHNKKGRKIQWLGDGIYFWSSNDSVGKEIGKNLAASKFRTNNIYGIHINIKVQEDNFLNLENRKWADKFEEFLKVFQPDYYEKVNHYIEMIQTMKKPDTPLLNKLGKITGTALNNFIEILEEEENYSIDMVSYYFLHGKNEDFLFQRNEKTVPQFCVRNVDIANDGIKNCEVEYIN